MFQTIGLQHLNKTRYTEDHFPSLTSLTSPDQPNFIVNGDAPASYLIAIGDVNNSTAAFKSDSLIRKEKHEWLQ